MVRFVGSSAYILFGIVNTVKVIPSTIIEKTLLDFTRLLESREQYQSDLVKLDAAKFFMDGNAIATA